MNALVKRIAVLKGVNAMRSFLQVLGFFAFLFIGMALAEAAGNLPPIFGYLLLLGVVAYLIRLMVKIAFGK